MAELSRQEFAQVVIERVRERFPLVKIARARESFSLRVNGHVASLEDLYRIAQLRPDDVQHQIERWAVELLRAGEGSPDRVAEFDELKDRILPMLVNGATDADRLRSLASQPLVADLHVTYVIDGDRTISYIPKEALLKWSVDVDDLHEAALANLVDRSQKLEAHAAQNEVGDVSLILFQMLDGFDASRLLLPQLHKRLRGHIESPFVAAVPNRDILLCFRDDEETVEHLRQQIKNDYRTMPHHVSDELILVTPDGLSKYGGSL